MIVEYFLWSFGIDPTSLYSYGYLPSEVYTIILNYQAHWFFKLSFEILLVFAVILSAIFLSIALFSVLYRYKNKEAEFILEKAPTVTIHIPTRNELVALNCAKRCLESDYPEGKFDIILGDDSDDPSVSIKLKEFADKYSNVKVMQREQNIGYKPGNLNNMLKGTEGEIVVIFDSDFLPAKDFLKRIVAPFIHDPELAASQARWVPYNSDKNLTTTLATGINEVFHQIFLPFMYHVSGSVTLCGSAEAVRRSKLEKLGNWKSGSFTEDIEYSMRLYKTGNKVAYSYDLTCECELPQKPIDLYKQQMRWAYGVVGSIIEHGWDIFRAKVPWTLKANVAWIGLGYVLTTMIFLLFSVGMLSFITHPPGPIDYSLFLKETIINIGLTSGLMIAFGIAMIKSKKILRIPSIIAAALSIGLVVTYYANKGIYRVLTDGEMDWFLVKKDGNSE